MYLPDPNPKPDFGHLLAILQRKKPARPTLFEFFLNPRLHRHLAPQTDEQALAPYAFERQALWAYYHAGYDHANVMLPGFRFPSGRRLDTQTVSLNEGSMILDWPTFDAYPWPDPEHADLSILDALGSEMPTGMKLIVYGPNGVLENVIDLVGYERLCYLLTDDPHLVERVFEEVSTRLVRYYELASCHLAVGACIDNDDWGFKTHTLLSPRHMRRYVFPWHRQIVEMVHRAGKPVILHSCGHFERILDDLFEMGFDGRHSYEDAIMPVEEAYERFHDRFAVLGGIDVDFLCRNKPAVIYERSRAMLERSVELGSYALGSGNSIPDYVPDESFFAMIRAATDLRS